MRTYTHKDIVLGHVNGLSVGDFIGHATLKYALVTSLDSDTNTAAMLKTSPALTNLEATVLGNAFVALTKDLKARQMFYGFDEVWLFPDIPTIEKPDVWIVEPSKIGKKLSELDEWMSKTECVIGVGDGDGRINYARRYERQDVWRS